MTRPLRALLQNVLPSNQDWKIKLLQSWQQIMGNLSSKVRLEKIENEQLILGVFDACWMQELYLLTPMLLANINKNLDHPRIKQLRFRRVTLYTPAQARMPVQRTTKQSQKRPLTQREAQALDALVDTDLREVLVQYLERCNREKT